MTGRRRRDEPESSQRGAETPPPPPTMAQAIAAVLDSRAEQRELLEQLVSNTAPQERHQGRNAPEEMVTFSDFLSVRPPVFSDAGEPLEADH